MSQSNWLGFLQWISSNYYRVVGDIWIVSPNQQKCKASCKNLHKHKCLGLLEWTNYMPLNRSFISCDFKSRNLFLPLRRIILYWKLRKIDPFNSRTFAVEAQEMFIKANRAQQKWEREWKEKGWGRGERWSLNGGGSHSACHWQLLMNILNTVVSGTQKSFGGGHQFLSGGWFGNMRERGCPLLRYLYCSWRFYTWNYHFLKHVYHACTHTGTLHTYIHPWAHINKTEQFQLHSSILNCNAG